MRIHATVLSVALLCTSALATDEPQIRTTSDFGVLAKVGRQGNLDSVAQGTEIFRGLELFARDQGYCDYAEAYTRVRRTQEGGGSSTWGHHSRRSRGSRCGHGGTSGEVVHCVSISEYGKLCGRSGSAGTTDAAPGTSCPDLAPHALEVVYAAAPGSRGIVTIEFRGCATYGAGGNAAIDLDGDGEPEFTAETNTRPQQVEIPVVAGPNGVVIAIVTEGWARSGCRGSEYNFSLEVCYEGDSGGHDCRFTPFGEGCGLRLDTALVDVNGSEHLVRHRVGNAVPGSNGIIMIGDQLATPLPLPIPPCSLLVDPLGIAVPFVTDGCGRAIVDVPITLHCVIIGIQALTIDPISSQMTKASRGILFTCCY